MLDMKTIKMQFPRLTHKHNSLLSLIGIKGHPVHTLSNTEGWYRSMIMMVMMVMEITIAPIKETSVTFQDFSLRLHSINYKTLKIYSFSTWLKYVIVKYKIKGIPR